MQKRVKSILYVRLPCWKIYPGGVIYVADFIHKNRPDIRQEIIDFALIPAGERKKTLVKKLDELKPDTVAFSWRNMQTFGPHPENDALDIVMSYDYSPKLKDKLSAMNSAIKIIYDYIAARVRNFGYFKLVRRMLPDTDIVVGGTAVSIFGKYVIEKCPNNSTVVIGEGEDTMLSLVNRIDEPEGDYFHKDGNGCISFKQRKKHFDLKLLTAVDFEYIDSIFDGFREHLDDYIGIQTKRGCPYKCLFCLYNKIEGAAERQRDPHEVAKEVNSISRQFGARKVWFTDAQFCSTKKSIAHSDAILGGIEELKPDIEWTGYLRLENFTPELARKALATGICSIDTTFTGSQNVINKLKLGYSIDRQMDTFKFFERSGFKNQQVKLYMPFNAPGETIDTLKETIKRTEELYNMFGRDRIVPFIFFIGVQPGTPIERYLKDAGYLQENYDPLTLNPFTIKKLLYNPQPLGKILGQAYLGACAKVDDRNNGFDSEHIGRFTIDMLKQNIGQS